MKPHPPVIVVLGPSRGAVSGVSTHLNLLFASGLARDFVLRHFQVGSEGRAESASKRLLRLLASPFVLAAYLLRETADIVHINTSLDRRAFWRDLAYLLVAKLCGARVIYQVHGGALPVDFSVANRLPQWLVRAILHWPDIVVVLAKSEMTAYRDFVPGQVVVVLPNGIDLAPYAATVVAREAATAARRTPGMPLHLLYIGRLVRDKGIHDALRGLALALERGTVATLTIAGSGPAAPTLKALAHQLGIERAVRFVGPVFDHDKQALFALADAMVLPTYAEGLPYALLEGMASGIPAIATRVGGIPDVMNEGEHGLFVPPSNAPAIADAIDRLTQDRTLLSAMGAACRRRIAHAYSIERLAGDFRRLYWELSPQRRADVLGKS